MVSKKLKLHQKITAPLSHVFYSFNNKSGWMDWFAYKAYGHAKTKAVLRPSNLPEGNFAFYFTDEELDERIAFDFIDLDIKHISQVEVSFEEEGGIVTVFLEHSGLLEEKYEEIKQIWENGLVNLKIVIEEGKDPRTWDRAYMGFTMKEWLTREIAREKNLPVEYGIPLDSVFSGGGAEKAGLQKGDIIVKIAGKEMYDEKTFKNLWESLRPGDIVSLSYFRGNTLHDVEVQLSGYPLPEPPPTAHDFAEQIERFQRSAHKRISRILEDYNDAQISFRPGPNEWSARETLGHLIAYESDLQTWVSTMVTSCEEFPCSASRSPRIKSLLSLFPTVESLLTELADRQKETTALLLEIPAEFEKRKGSFFRLTSDMNWTVRRHYKHHIAQIKESLEKAGNVRVS